MEGSTSTKIRIDLKERIIELEGSETFVSTQMEWLKDVILSTPITTELELIEEKTAQSEIPSQIITTQIVGNQHTNKIFDKYKTFFGIDKEVVDSVIHTEDNNFTIITKKIKGGNADKQIQYSLLYCLAKEFYGQSEISTEELRELCRDNACLDASNFNQYFNTHKDLFIVNGKPRTRNKTIKLTSPGRNKAKELLNSLAV